jgi:predicted peptidase
MDHFMNATRCQFSILGLLPFLLISAPMKTKAQSTNAALLPKSMTWEISRRGEMRYLAYLPRDYDPKRDQRWPLMLFLHGAGERGTDLQRVAIHGPPSLVKQGRNFPFILIAPQCPEDERWQNDSLLKLLEHVMKEYKVDTGRVYLTGLSMGGYGTWKLGLAHPEKFAAIAPICGGGEYIDALLASRTKAAALRSLPVWAFHGAKDQVVPLEESERMVKALKKVGCKDVKLTVYPEANHNSWTETYNNPELYEWLLKQARKQ